MHIAVYFSSETTQPTLLLAATGELERQCGRLQLSEEVLAERATSFMSDSLSFETLLHQQAKQLSQIGSRL